MRVATDLYSRITESVIAAVAANPDGPGLPWHRSTAIPSNALTGRPYRGINILSLWLAASAKGYPTAQWASYRQWLELGAQVRKGERGSPIVFYRTQESDDETELGKRARPLRIARAYHVFNAAQVDGWTPPAPPTLLSEVERQDHAEAFFAAVGASVVHEGDRACYRPTTDTIHMPPFSSFKSGLGYYAVLGHEHVHWTGAAHRLDRLLETNHHSLAYAGEELVAELGSAFLCAALALTPEPRPDHAGYIASWLKLLRDDSRAIVRAASLATQAVEYLQAKAEEHRHAPATQIAAA